MATNAEIINFEGAAVDRLGDIRAQIAALKDKEKVLVTYIAGLGDGVHEGDLFRAAVSTTADRYSLDPKAAEAKLRELGVDGRWFSKNQKVTRGSTSVRVSARKS